MQFWTNELIATVGLAILGFILLTFVTAWLYSSRVFVRRGRETTSRWAADAREVSRSETIDRGQIPTTFIITSVVVIMIGAVGVLLFAFDLWNSPLLVSDYNLNLQLIFVVFAVFTFIISFAIAALYTVSKSSSAKIWS